MGTITKGKSQASEHKQLEKIRNQSKRAGERFFALAEKSGHAMDNRKIYKPRPQLPLGGTGKALFEPQIKSLAEVRHHGRDAVRTFWYEPSENQRSDLMPCQRSKGKTKESSMWNPCGSAAEWQEHGQMVPYGPSSRKINNRLKDRVDQIQRELRFDVMVSTDGTFKRQVWADMMRDGVIGGDAQSSGSLKERDWGAEGFRKLLARRYGSATRGWRLALDADRKGRVSFVEFCQATRSIGYEGPLRRLWGELAGEGAFITLERIDHAANKRLGIFRDMLWKKCGGIKQAWLFFDHQHRRRLNLLEFKKRCAALGLVPADMALASGVAGADSDGDSSAANLTQTSSSGFKRRGAGVARGTVQAQQQEADPELLILQNNIDKIFDDLDTNASGGLSWLEFQWLESWLSDQDVKELESFRNFMLTKFPSCREVVDAIGTPHITIEVFTAFCDKHKYPGSAERMFQVMDQDGNGTLSGSEIIRIFAALPPTSQTVKPVDSYNPMPAIASTLAASKGIDLDRNAVQALGRPIQASFFIYERCLKHFENTENNDLKKLMSIKDEIDDTIMQPEPELDILMVEAEEAQNGLKRKICPGGASWYPRTFCPQPASWVDKAYDPHIKSRARIEAKASVKYAARYGDQRFRRVRDISRLALMYKSCASMFNAIKKCKEVLDVVFVENRMRVPTALGWRDITILVKEPLKSGSYHICEIQFQLEAFAEARKEAHKHYTALREMLPKLFPQDDAAALDEVTHQILDGLTAAVKSFSFDTGNVACNMERGKSWTTPWQKNPMVACEREKYPAKRPTMHLASKNSEFMDKVIEQRSGPVIPTLYRGRPWQPVMQAPMLFSALEPDSAFGSDMLDKKLNDMKRDSMAQTHAGEKRFSTNPRNLLRQDSLRIQRGSMNPRNLPGSDQVHTQSATAFSTVDVPL